MASVKISELNELLVVTSDDFIPIVDSGSGTTYRTTFNVINDWMASFGSASHAEIADFAHTSTSASYALSASWAETASYAHRAKTASYYDLTGFNAETATSASYAKTASVLQGHGTSWENTLLLSSSLQLSASATIYIPRKRDIENESTTQNCIFFHSEYAIGAVDVGKNDWTRIYYAEDVTDSGRMVFEHGDNLDTQLPAGPNIDFHGINSPGFLWQTYENTGPYATGSLMFLKTDGMLYVRSVEARNFTSSLSVGVGFLGTASYAVYSQTASYVQGGITASAIMPSIITGLFLKPYWESYDGAASAHLIDVDADIVVVHESTNTVFKQLSGVNQTNNRTVTGAGGILPAGTYAQNAWYDIFVIYRSDTEAQSTIIMKCSSSPNEFTFEDDVYPALTAAGQSEWDYGHIVGSVYDDNGTWRQWIEQGAQPLEVYRGLHPTGIGISNGYTISHNFGLPPRNVKLKVKVIKNSTSLNTNGFYKGDEIRGEDLISDSGGGSVEHQAFLTITNPTQVRVGWTQHTNGYEISNVSGAAYILSGEVANLALYVYMWK